MAKRDRPAEIEVTPAMIEAGEFALSCARDWSLSEGPTVVEVYRAMAALASSATRRSRPTDDNRVSRGSIYAKPKRMSKIG